MVSLSQLYKDRDNKVFKLYIDIKDLKAQMKKGMYTYKDTTQIYKDTIDYIYDNLNSESEMQEYLNKNYFNRIYTLPELQEMPFEKSHRILQTNGAVLELYSKQYEFYRETKAVKLKCSNCGHIQDTYPLADEKTNPCEKCKETVFVDIDTNIDDGYIVCCGIKSKIVKFTDSFANCYATHVYECPNCKKRNTVYLFREE